MTNRQRYDLSKAVDRALQHVEVSADTGCSLKTFAHALETGRLDERSRTAVALFLDEGEFDAIVELVGEGAASFVSLARLAEQLLEPDHPTRVFLERAPS